MFELPSSEPQLVTDYVRQLKFVLRVVHSHARETAALEHAHQEEHYNRRVKGSPLVAGQFVFVKDPALHRGEHRKFHRPWRGPFRVLSVLGSTSYVVNVDGRPKTLHFNRLKPAHLQPPCATLSNDSSLPPAPPPLPDQSSTAAAPVLPHYVPEAVDCEPDPLQVPTPSRLTRTRQLPHHFADFVLY